MYHCGIKPEIETRVHIENFLFTVVFLDGCFLKMNSPSRHMTLNDVISTSMRRHHVNRRRKDVILALYGHWAACYVFIGFLYGKE